MTFSICEGRGTEIQIEKTLLRELGSHLSHAEPRDKPGLGQKSLHIKKVANVPSNERRGGDMFLLSLADRP